MSMSTSDSEHEQYAHLPKTRQEAAAVGCNQYFTGEPCPKGHTSTRRTANSGCMACARERAKKDRQHAQSTMSAARREKIGPTRSVAERQLTRDDEGGDYQVPTHQLANIDSLEDIVRLEGYDPERHEVQTARLTSWHAQTPYGIEELASVRTTIRLKPEAEARDLLGAFQAVLAEHEPPPAAPAPPQRILAEPALLELAIMDAHIGALAWGRETGEKYDSQIAASDYMDAATQLLAIGTRYDVERILYIVGNDLLHVDTPGLGGKGGTTTAGTPQDVDTRLLKMFEVAGSVVRRVIDQARLIAPVDVVCVPGNHDEQRVQLLGFALGWLYENDERVTIQAGPSPRKIYSYGRNALMLTHGEDVKRKRESLPLIFADEFPQAWAAARCREIHMGHFHSTAQGGYSPNFEVDESRGVRTRSLPGLTATDNWHKHKGYRHVRASTGLLFRHDGGVLAHHEVYPPTVYPAAA